MKKVTKILVVLFLGIFLVISSLVIYVKFALPAAGIKKTALP